LADRAGASVIKLRVLGRLRAADENGPVEAPYDRGSYVEAIKPNNAPAADAGL
jgi:hypothetical protein